MQTFLLLQQMCIATGQVSEKYALYLHFCRTSTLSISDLKTYRHSAFLIYNYQYTKKI